MFASTHFDGDDGAGKAECGDHGEEAGDQADFCGFSEMYDDEEDFDSTEYMKADLGKDLIMLRM